MVETDATGRPFPGFENIKEDIIADIDDTYDLGSDDKRWAYIFAVIAVLTSIVIGGVVGISTLDSWLFINASTMINGSLNISEDLFVDGTLTAGSINVTNLTVENMNFTNLTITGDIFNISATVTYVNDLFPNEYCTFDLGSIGLRWDNGYFCHNVSAEYFLGDGSYLTNLPTGDNASWNESYANTLYADISVTGDNASWNESHANTLYRDIAWDNFTGIPHAAPSDGDVTHFSLADEIYDWAVGLFLQTTDRTNIAMTNQTNIFTANQNLSSHNFTDIDCFIFDSGGKICSGV